MGTIKVLEACRNFGVKKIVYAASSSCYGLAETPTNKITLLILNILMHYQNF